MAAFENWLSRRKGKRSIELYKLDTVNKTPEENIIDIIQGLYIQKPVQNETSPTNRTSADFKSLSGLRNMPRSSSDHYRLSYLTALVTLLCKTDRKDLGFTTEELMTCIRLSLIDDSVSIREASLKVLRYLIKNESDVAIFNNLKLPYLVVRSIDLILRNEEERAQALRVIRRVVGVVGAVSVSSTGGAGPLRRRAVGVDAGLLRCLAAVARASTAGDTYADRLSRPAVATLAEICVLNAEQFVRCGGVGAVLGQLGECATPRMAEALCGALLHALDSPAARALTALDLSCLAAPYCDFHTRPTSADTNRDDREMRFTCSRLALLCVLRSWPGLLHFCHPRRAGGLRALVDALYLPRLEVRKAILDLLYELVGLPQPEWTDEISVALDAVDPSDFQDSWRLNEGFVAAEGTAILPHLSATGPDITEIHLALLLQCFLEAGLLDGLAEVIVTSDTFISVRATVLLGQLLHLIHLLLPPQVCSVTPALPTLMCQASAGKPQALAAVAALRRLHSMLESRPASNSLFLDHIIQYCSGAFVERDSVGATKTQCDVIISVNKENSIEYLDECDNEGECKQRHSVGSRADVPARNVSALVKSKSVSSRTSAAVSKVAKSTKFFGLFDRDSDSLIRNTLVMQNKDGNTWNWEIIRTVLKENDKTPFLNLQDGAHRAWAARVISYLKPSANKYSHTDLTSTGHGHSATRAGCQLIRHLLRHYDLESQRLLEDFFWDVSREIEAIETGRRAHECLFSPQHMSNTMCQMYFLFIGQLCHSHNGLKLFKQTKLYENLLELSTNTHHSCYVKLVITSLDYTMDSYPRDILAKTLTCSIQASRLYVTQFLNVILRASHKSGELFRGKFKLRSHGGARAGGDSERAAPGHDMETWLLRALVGQVKDECRTVVKCALAILEEAYSVPVYLEKLITLKDTLRQNCRIDGGVKWACGGDVPVGVNGSSGEGGVGAGAGAGAGDRGYLLWLCLEVHAAAAAPNSQDHVRFLKKHLDYWTKCYNFRYARLVEASAHDALTLGGEEAARGARARRLARPPPHLHAALVADRALPAHAHATHSARAQPRPVNSLARTLLAPVLPLHYKVLQRKQCTSEQEIMELKASLWALGHTAATAQGLQLVLALGAGAGGGESVPQRVVRLATRCAVYSVRAAALHVLGLIASTRDGADALAELGWLCVRHTRHEQFPMIQEELCAPQYAPGAASRVASPDRRAAPDADLSEHSDHTDLSVADSLPSDCSKLKSTEQADTKDQDVVDSIINSLPDKRKSHTLPIQGCSSERPTLSESRTVDILRDCSNYETAPHRLPIPENRLLIGRMNSLDYAYEGRVRNTSESSTSGVSSCDSFLGKYAIPERIVTLSPIPSSSSLYGMKSNSSSQRPRLSESQRRISTSSFTAPESASSPPTQMDMTGYATVKALNKHRRPHLSESAASGSSDMDDISWLLTDTHKRSSKPFSSLRDRTKSTRERLAKQSLLEYDWRPLPLAEGDAEVGAAAGVGVPPARAPRAPLPPPTTQTYIGICLPSDIAQLFPSEKDDEPWESGESKGEGSRRARVPSRLAGGDSSGASDHRARATPDSQKPSLTRGSTRLASAGASGPAVGPCAGAGDSSTTTAGRVNNASDCESSKLTKQGEAVAVVSTSTQDMTAGIPIPNNSEAVPTKLVVRTSGVSASVANYNAAKEAPLPDGGEGGEGSRPAGEARWRHATADCLACVRTRPPSSHELREAFFAGMELPASGASSPPEPAPAPAPAPAAPPLAPAPQAELLRHVHFMSNPIHFRQSRSAIISLKQRHPELFRSACLYSEVCARLARGTYMLCARRFLQDQFLEVSFDCFKGEPAALLARHPPRREPAPAPTPAPAPEPLAIH